MLHEKQAVVVNPEPPKPAKLVPVPNGKAARKEEAAKPAVEAKKEPPK